MNKDNERWEELMRSIEAFQNDCDKDCFEYEMAGMAKAYMNLSESTKFCEARQEVDSLRYALDQLTSAIVELLDPDQTSPNRDEIRELNRKACEVLAGSSLGMDRNE